MEIHHHLVLHFGRMIRGTLHEKYRNDILYHATDVDPRPPPKKNASAGQNRPFQRLEKHSIIDNNHYEKTSAPTGR